MGYFGKVGNKVVPTYLTLLYFSLAHFGDYLPYSRLTLLRVFYLTGNVSIVVIIIIIIIIINYFRTRTLSRFYGIKYCLLNDKVHQFLIKLLHLRFGR